MIAHSLVKFYIKHILSILNLAYNSISYSLVPDWKKEKPKWTNKFTPEHISYNNFPKWVKLTSGKKNMVQ